MKRYTLILPLLFACTVEDADDGDIAASESGDAENDDGESFRSGPTFTVSETIDKCCPVIGGVVQDSLCGDDVANACPAASFPIGGGITSWSVVNCFTCGSDSRNCSNTRWINHGTYGFECGGVSTRRSTNALIDDDCGTNTCTGAGYQLEEDECAGVCGIDSDEYPLEACQTGTVDKTVGAMCCTNNNATDCIPPYNDVTTTTPSCDRAEYTANGLNYNRLTWCYPCDGSATSDEVDGGWDLLGAGGGAEYENSVSCSPDLVSSGSIHLRPTRYHCGGFAFLYSGASFTETCSNYP